MKRHGLDRLDGDVPAGLSIRTDGPSSSSNEEQNTERRPREQRAGAAAQACFIRKDFVNLMGARHSRGFGLYGSDY